MNYDENRDPRMGLPGEIAFTWIFAAIIVVLVMIALGVFN